MAYSFKNCPPGWQVKTIEDVFEVIRGVSFPTSAKTEKADEYVGCLRTANVQKEIVWDDLWHVPIKYMRDDTKLVREHDIIISIANSLNLLGKTSYVHCVPEKSTFGTFVANLRAKEDRPRYLYYFLQSRLFLDQVVANASTTTNISNISTTKLKNLCVLIPDLSEQDCIITKIEELLSQLDEGVETLKKTQAKLEVYRQAVLKEAFEGKLTTHLPMDISLEWVVQEDASNLPAIPDEWRYIPLSKIGDLGRGKSKHRPRNDPRLFEEGKYPFLQTSEVKAAKHYVTEYSKMYGEFGLQQSKLWPKGTLCITIAANIAETAFLGIDACFPDSVVGFTPFEYVLPEYVKHFIESQKIRLWAFAPATAQKNINLDTLENLLIPYCSIDEQKSIISEIESRMSMCDNIEQTVEIALLQAEAMRQSILKQAFEGRL